jgi:hypothetical protein
MESVYIYIYDKYFLVLDIVTPIFKIHKKIEVMLIITGCHYFVRPKQGIHISCFEVLK